MKAYTDLEQSKKLAEFLPIESADMKILPFTEREYRVVPINDIAVCNIEDEIYCWSLAALLEQLDDEITDENGNDYNLTIVKENLQYQLYYHDSWGQVEDIETDYYDDLVDACVEMILKLKEENLL